MKTPIPLALTILAVLGVSVGTSRAQDFPDGKYVGHNTAEGDLALRRTLRFFPETEAPSVNNTALGFHALMDNTEGNANTATGAFALEDNKTGGSNTATGALALHDNKTGASNTANGAQALSHNTTGFNNTAIGDRALITNTTGDTNTATGDSALLHNTTGINNTAIGARALHRNTTGNVNIALGVNAGFQLTTGGRNIDIGNDGEPGESATIRIGDPNQTRTFIAGISGVTVAGGAAVAVNASGQLGTSTSSARFKEAIKPMDKASEAILALQPVTFHYKHELDPDGIPQFGLVAEEVEKVNPALVLPDKEGKPYTVRYEAVNAMLLNEFIKARRQIDSQQKQIEALTAGLQKVIAQLEASKPTAQLALKNQ